MSDELVFDTTEFEAQLNQAWLKLISENTSRLMPLALKVKATAQKYCPVDTGRLRSAIYVGPLVKESKTRVSVEVGVSLASLKEASARAQAKIDRNVKAVLKGERKGLGFSKNSRVTRQSGEVTVNYGVFVEYGTSKMHAQPFMRPALAEVAGLRAF